MSGKFKLFLAVGFVFMQALAFAHTAEAGFEPHQHDGHDCQIYYHCENAMGTALAAPIFVASPHIAAPATPLINNVITKEFRTAAPRAPPAA